MGWAIPQMAHIPLIHGPDGAKLSKRHGALGIDAYQAMGYLPQALRNYLVRLGWSHGNQEVFSTQEMIDAFDLNTIGRSPARFDFAKLENLNGIYLRESDDTALVQALEDLLPILGEARSLPSHFTPDLKAKLTAAMPGLKERAKTLVEILDSAYYLYAQVPLAFDAKAAALLDEPARWRLGAMAERLRALDDWGPSALEAAVRSYAEETGIKLGQIAQPLRAGLTGRATSPGLFDVMAVLGREACLARLDAVSAVQASAATPSLNPA
jgi:glutamyl-tRNA synthetase